MSGEMKQLLIGAVVGGSVVAAVVSGIFGVVAGSQQGNQATEQFLREERKAAYSEFMAAQEEADLSAEALYDYVGDVGNNQIAFSRTTATELTNDISLHLREANAAYWSVRLVGSQEAADIAQGILRRKFDEEYDIRRTHDILQVYLDRTSEVPSESESIDSYVKWISQHERRHRHPSPRHEEPDITKFVQVVRSDLGI